MRVNIAKIFGIVFLLSIAFVIAPPGYRWNQPNTTIVFNNTQEHIQIGNFSGATPLINFTLYDTAGINITGGRGNDTINISFFDLASNLSGGAPNASRNIYNNLSLYVNLNFTCHNVTMSGENATVLDCNFTAPTLPEGNVTLNITFQNIQSQVNSTEISFIIDLHPPQLGGFIDTSYASNVVAKGDTVLNDTYINENQIHMLLAFNISENITSVSNVTVEGTKLNRSYYSNSVPYLQGSEIWNGTFYLANLSNVPDGSSNNLTIIATDAVGNQNITYLYYVVDRTPPVLSSTTVTNGQRVSSPVGFLSVNYTVTEVNLSYSQIDIDGGAYTQKNNTNGSGDLFRQYTTNVEAGFHKIKLTMVDNASHTTYAYYNFTMMAFMNASDIVGGQLNQSSTFSEFVPFFLNASITNNTGVQLDQIGNVTPDYLFYPNTTLGLKFVSKNRADVNATAFMFFAGSNVTWNQTKGIRVQYNESSNSSDALRRNYGAVFNATGQRNLYIFSAENMSHAFGNTFYGENGTALWQFVFFANANMSLSSGTTYQNYSVIYSDDDYGGNAMVLSACSSLKNNIPNSFPARENSCYVQGPANWSKNLGLGHTNGTMVFVPHFSTVVIVDVNAAPLINTTTPDDRFGTFNDSTFTAAGLIRDLNLNTSSCTYQFGFQNGTNLKGNNSFTPTQTFGASANYTFSITDSTFENLFNDTYTLGIRCASLQIGSNVNSTNITEHIHHFSVTDNTRPTLTATPISTVTTNTAQITFTASEVVNSTLYIGVKATNLQINQSNTAQQRSWTLDLPGLLGVTTYFYNLTLCDRNGNCNTLGPYSFTTTEQSLGGTGGTGGGSTGGGGGGSASTQPKAVSTSIRYSTITAGQSNTFSIAKSDIPVTAVKFKVNQLLSAVDLEVSGLIGKPSGVRAPTKEVYKYIEIIAPKLKDEVLSSASIQFTVPNAWIKDNGFTAEDIVLARYRTGKWVELSTQSKSSGLYEASTPGFSYFAILGGIKKEEKVKKDSTTDKNTNEDVTAKDNVLDEKKETIVVPPILAPVKFNWWVAVVIFLILSVIGYFVFRYMS